MPQATPSAVYGTWKGASRTVDFTSLISYNGATYPKVTLTPGADPSTNGWTGIPDQPPGGFAKYGNEGYSAEIKWNVNDLKVNGSPLIAGHVYRVQFLVHDGDQSNSGGDTGQGCMTVVIKQP